MRSTVRRAGVVAVALSVALLGGSGIAGAQQDAEVATTTTESTSSSSTEPTTTSPSESSESTSTEESTPDEEVPAPLVSVAANCAIEADSYGTVDIRGAENVDYVVRVIPEGSDDSIFAEGTADETGYLRVEFFDIPAGDHLVEVIGSDGSSNITQANVRPCDDIEDVESELDVEVRCFQGSGLVIFTVSNLSNDPESERTVTLSVDDIELYEFPGLPAGFLLTVSENSAPDGEYTAQLTEDGRVIDTEDFVVACADNNGGGSTTPGAPPAQGSPGPGGNDGGGLAYTGAAVGGLAALGALVLGLGGLLVFLGRRRAGSTPTV